MARKRRNKGKNANNDNVGANVIRPQEQENVETVENDVVVVDDAPVVQETEKENETVEKDTGDQRSPQQQDEAKTVGANVIRPQENETEIETNETVEIVVDNVDPIETIVDDTAGEQCSPLQPNQTSKNNIFKTAFILAAITLITAAILAVLNGFTAPVIAERLANEKTESIAKLFDGIEIGEISELREHSDLNPDNLPYEEVYNNYSAPIIEVLEIYSKEGKNVGWCVNVAPKGFNGAINMLVAVRDENNTFTVIDTAVLTMSETAGQGTKIEDESFKSQFIGKSKNIKANEVNNINSIDTIANATISSKAYLNGVNAALNFLSDNIRVWEIIGVVEETSETNINTNEEINQEEEGE